MRKNGFTLIELLAVIVILAIIALIATPIILGIINDAREESNERSVELYASAVRNGIVAYQLSGKVVTANTYNKETLPFEVEYEGNVVCDIIRIYSDGNVYLEGCKVNGTEVEYTYGEKQQVYKPQYYYFDFITLGSNVVISNPSSVPPAGKNYYLGYDLDENNKITTAYACFVRNEIEYCLKGRDKGASFAKNTEIIKEAYADVVDTDACAFDNNISRCNEGGLSVHATLESSMSVGEDSVYCHVLFDGDLECVYRLPSEELD